MAKKLPTKKQREEYIKFLEKRVNSPNYKSAVSDEEFNKTKQKLDKERLLIKMV